MDREKLISDFQKWCNEHPEAIKNSLMTPEEYHDFLFSPEEQPEWDYWEAVYEGERAVEHVQALREYCLKHLDKRNHGTCVFKLDGKHTGCALTRSLVTAIKVAEANLSKLSVEDFTNKENK